MRPHIMAAEDMNDNIFRLNIFGHAYFTSLWAGCVASFSAWDNLTVGLPINEKIDF